MIQEIIIWINGYDISIFYDKIRENSQGLSSSGLHHLFLGLGHIGCSSVWDSRQRPWWLPDCHICSNSWGLRRLSIHFCCGLLYNLPSSADAPSQSFLSCSYGWIAQQYPVQMCSQHLLDSSPNPNDHLGQTIANHTLDPHEEPLEFSSGPWYYQEFQLKEINRHEDRKTGFQQLQSMANNQRVLWGISKHLSSRIFCSIHHKSHRPVLFAWTHGCLSKL